MQQLFALKSWPRTSQLLLSPFKKAIQKHFITSRSQFSRSFKIFENVAEIFYHIKFIKFWNWMRLKKCFGESCLSLPISSLVKNVVILCGTNNIFVDSYTNIAECIFNIGPCLREKSSNISDFMYGLISRNESWFVNSILIKDFNRILKCLCDESLIFL